MPTKKTVTYWACDFETTVWGEEIEKEKGKQQTETEVWAAASVKLYDNSEEVRIDGGIRDFLDYFLSQKTNNVLYFHNLSFDGSFIIDFLLRNGYEFTNCKDKYMKSKEFNVCISEMGDWYFMKIKKGHVLLEIRNSLKLIPASLERIGKSFKTKHQKLSMEYYGDRRAYCNISEEEEKYIKNDVLVLKEALERMFDEGHKKLTIGSCCLSEFKATYDKKDYKIFFPNLQEEYIDERYHGAWDAWEYIHKSYSGGWCYVHKPRTVIEKGVVYDVNSLYPSMMHSISGNRYPVGYPTFFEKEPPLHIVKNLTYYWFIRFKCRFKLKPNKLPWVHIRGNPMYRGNENLHTSDIEYRGQYSRYYVDSTGNITDTIIEMTMTMTDWELFRETYDIYNLEYLGGCYFRTEVGLFDDYIDPYKQQKETSEGFLRELAKLFLNNLYGKLAMSDNSSYKIPYLDEDGYVKFKLQEEHEKTVGYIPCGTAITSYARNFTIRAALDNIDRFCYADTDSVHLEGWGEPNGIKEHPTELCCWKQEGKFDTAYYERQKVYAEHMVEKDHIPVEPYLDLKCAGMSKNAKKKFLDDGYNIDELSVGLELETANLKAVRVKGGIILRNTDFKLREKRELRKELYYG